VNLQRIASAIELEFINPEMVPFVLPNMFLIAVIEREFDYYDNLFFFIIRKNQQMMNIKNIFSLNLNKFLKFKNLLK
jgi:hypothetical protein